MRARGERSTDLVFKSGPNIYDPECAHLHFFCLALSQTRSHRSGEANCVFSGGRLLITRPASFFITRPARRRTKTRCGGLGATKTLSSLTHYPLLQNGDGGANTPVSGKVADPLLRDPQFLATRTPGPVALAAVAR